MINTASFVATMGAATSQIAYTASKGGVLALSRELGVEFARRGVRVNALCPGPVDTPLLRELFAKDAAAAARRLIHVPMGRFAKVREVADAALFLASDESSYVTATAFMVDGGISQAYVTPECAAGRPPRGRRCWPRCRPPWRSCCCSAGCRRCARPWRRSPPGRRRRRWPSRSRGASWPTPSATRW